jgi:hypothetical protein
MERLGKNCNIQETKLENEESYEYLSDSEVDDYVFPEEFGMLLNADVRPIIYHADYPEKKPGFVFGHPELGVLIVIM